MLVTLICWGEYKCHNAEILLHAVKEIGLEVNIDNRICMNTV